jgi:hypothetical protein
MTWKKRGRGEFESYDSHDSTQTEGGPISAKQVRHAGEGILNGSGMAKATV